MRTDRAQLIALGIGIVILGIMFTGVAAATQIADKEN
jgi:hypothetical protein